MDSISKVALAVMAIPESSIWNRQINKLKEFQALECDVYLRHFYGTSPSYWPWVRYLGRDGTSPSYWLWVRYLGLYMTSPVKTVTVPARPIQIRAHHHIDIYTDINYSQKNGEQLRSNNDVITACNVTLYFSLGWGVTKILFFSYSFDRIIAKVKGQHGVTDCMGVPY